ncbi:unnamed protein product [Rhodiola kirilowii]
MLFVRFRNLSIPQSNTTKLRKRKAKVAGDASILEDASALIKMKKKSKTTLTADGSERAAEEECCEKKKQMVFSGARSTVMSALRVKSLVIILYWLVYGRICVFLWMLSFYFNECIFLQLPS